MIRRFFLRLLLLLCFELKAQQISLNLNKAPILKVGDVINVKNGDELTITSNVEIDSVIVVYKSYYLKTNKFFEIPSSGIQAQEEPKHIIKFSVTKSRNEKQKGKSTDIKLNEYKFIICTEAECKDKMRFPRNSNASIFVFYKKSPLNKKTKDKIKISIYEKI
ncbi:MAG: hypothetical protein IPO70_11100 [Bacteroidetes bacterium]|nr:hypothetical protein [Bacteroidota bacterium]MBK9672773.1 hypothetical protein [Bacteroidota bacterium]MBP6412032.1 hypothetical protein [Bacteroidia bacterium]